MSARREWQKNLITHALLWYGWIVPKEILRGWGNILWYNLEYFSLFFLLQTLFAPWRRTQWSYGKGFDAGRWFETLAGNIISRILGGIIRSSLIVAGLLAEIGILFLGPLLLVLWFLLPVLFSISFFQGVFVAPFPSVQAYLLLAISLLGALLLLRSFYQSYAEAKPLAKAKKLAEFLQKEQRNLRFLFNRLLLNPKEIIESLGKEEPLALKNETKPEEVLVAAAKSSKLFERILLEFDISPNDVEKVAGWYRSLKERQRDRRTWWTKNNLRRHGTIGRHWTSGFSPLLDQFSVDLSEQVRRSGFPELINHEKEMRALERVLVRENVNNVLLIGQPGSGRRAIIQELARKSALGESMPELNYRRVLELDIPALLSHMDNTADREAALDQIFQEVVRSGNVILVIDDFHNFVGSGGLERPGTINIIGILAKYLASPQFPVIAVTTFTGLHRDIEQHPSILSSLEKVEVQEISEDQALEILQSMVPFLEARYKKFISFQALLGIVQLSQKYIQATPQPKKALDILDEVMVALSQSKEKILLPKHVAGVVSEKTEIPIGEMEAKEKETLLNLEDLIHQRIINQNEAVREISSALRRARTEVGSRKGPMGSFLFMGPTGVGKTETAKALAAIYFGSESRMIRLDMSEFQNPRDIVRLLGAPGNEGLLTTAVRETPFSLILLDELEKAHSNILNLFLQVLDEGHITDGLGRKIDFGHTIIIATSNAGYQIILQALKEQKDFAKIKQKIFDQLFQEGVFRPEFLNRFDGVILFQPLSEQNLKDIAGLMLKKTQRNLKEKGIEFLVTEPLKAKMAELGYNPQFGARGIKRVIQDKVENALATALLKNDIKRGDTIEIGPQTFEVKVL